MQFKCALAYLSYPLSYRQLPEIGNEPGLDVNQTTSFRWVQRYSPELETRCRPHLRPTNDSWRVDKTHISVKGELKYLERAVDSDRNTLEFLLTALARYYESETLFLQCFESGLQSITSSD